MTTAAPSTSERIILTAERLFGERGLGSVSLREIAVEAGQRNSAAVHYHFGNKDALVQAVFDYRMVDTNAHRLRLLASMTADGRDADLHALLEALIRPLAEATGHADSHFGAFLLQLASVPPYRIRWSFDSAESIRLVWRGIERCLALPPHVADERKKMLTNLVIHTVADHERTGSDQWRRHLIDAAAGLLSAPVSGD